METTNYVEFKKTRDLGSIITDTFKFIRKNWKGYFGTIIRIAGPALVLLILSLGYYMVSLGGVMKGITNGGINVEPPEIFTFEVGIALLVAMISGLVFYVLMQTSSLYFIKSYIDNRGIVDRNEIISNVKQNFWKFLGYGILMMIMVMFGVMLCFFPGIYIAIVLSLGTSILVFEGKSVGDTISHCFKLIKDHWWETFGVLLVVGILVSILSMVFSIPALIYQMVTMMSQIGQDDPTAVLGLFSDPIYLALNALSYIGQFVLSSITLIATVFVYYDLNEQKNLTGTIEKIDRLGNV
ncbi:MAG: hypothetical protein COA67_01025 [Lutibacter sp.]|nr:MAG: hypothetical protein COA67_01025 [Lutibacter sp.]